MEIRAYPCESLAYFANQSQRSKESKHNAKTEIFRV